MVCAIVACSVGGCSMLAPGASLVHRASLFGGMTGRRALKQRRSRPAKKVANPTSRIFAAMVLVLGLLATPTYANVIMTASNLSAGGNVSAKADLAISGDILTVQVFNTSLLPTQERGDLICSFFFDIMDGGGNRPVLTYVSAVGDVWLTDKTLPDELKTTDADLKAVSSKDYTWEYRPLNCALNPFCGFGIGTVGNSGLAPNNFSGNIVDGADYAIYTGETTTQSVDGLLLVKDKATFTFSGVTGFTEEDIKTSCLFGLGTAPDSVLPSGAAPEPASLGLLSLALLAVSRRRRS